MSKIYNALQQMLVTNKHNLSNQPVFAVILYHLTRFLPFPLPSTRTNYQKNCTAPMILLSASPLNSQIGRVFLSHCLKFELTKHSQSYKRVFSSSTIVIYTGITALSKSSLNLERWVTTFTTCFMSSYLGVR